MKNKPAEMSYGEEQELQHKSYASIDSEEIQGSSPATVASEAQDVHFVLM